MGPGCAEQLLGCHFLAGTVLMFCGGLIMTGTNDRYRLGRGSAGCRSPESGSLTTAQLSPTMIDGAALNRMSLMKRTTSPERLPRLYSARKVPARMPVGVPIRVAINVITTLPKIAFSSPPLLPGAGSSG
jgi:hypothetical protein